MQVCHMYLRMSYRCAIAIQSIPNSWQSKAKRRIVNLGDEVSKNYRGVRESWVLPPTIPWLFFLGVLSADPMTAV